MALPPARGGTRWQPLACGLAGGLLTLDAVALLAMRLLNVGVVLPLLLGLAFLALAWRWDAVQRWLAVRGTRRTLWQLLWWGFGLWLVSLLAFWTWLAQSQHTGSASFEPQVILVLGSGTPGGKVSPVLAARLDAALREAATHTSALVVTSGGVGITETVSEAQVMGDYLRSHGLAAQRIVQEQRSSSTAENFAFTRALLQQRGIGPGAAVLVVTSDFHTVRSQWIARGAGFTDVALSGAPTPLYARYNAWLREYFAFASGFVLREFG